MTLLFSSFLFIISTFYMSTIIVKIQLNDSKFKNIKKYKFIIYNTVQIIYIPGYVMSHSDCYSVIVVQTFCNGK
jgi:hypothetical protein